MNFENTRFYQKFLSIPHSIPQDFSFEGFERLAHKLPSFEI